MQLNMMLHVFIAFLTNVVAFHSVVRARAFRVTSILKSTETVQVFIGNLPFTVDEAQIESIVTDKAGSGFTSVRIAKDRKMGTSRGFGYIDYSDRDQAEKVVAAMQGLQIDGRDIKVDISLGKKNGDSESRPDKPRAPRVPQENSVFIANLAFDTTESEVSDLCKTVLGDGKVSRVRFVNDRETGRPRGFGYIDFEDAESAAQAISDLNGAELRGRKVRLDKAQKKDASTTPGDRTPREQRERTPRFDSSQPQHTIFLGNLAWDVTQELLEDMLNDILGPGLFIKVFFF